MYAAIKIRDFAAIENLTKQMLSTDYTSMFAHKYLQQTYKITGDTLKSNRYHDIEMMCIYLITKIGNGTTCETGWHVTQIEEEYFILNMIGADLQMQSTTSGANYNCDAIKVKTEEGNIKVYYFKANKIFEMEVKVFGK